MRRNRAVDGDARRKRASRMSFGRRRQMRGRERRLRLGPRRLAELSIAHPRRVLAIWGALFVVGVLLAGRLLPSGLITEDHVTNNPESQRAQRLIDERLPDHNAVDEVVIVRSDRSLVSDAVFAAYMRRLVDGLGRTGAVRGITSYLPRIDPVD